MNREWKNGNVQLIQNVVPRAKPVVNRVACSLMRAQWMIVVILETEDRAPSWSLPGMFLCPTQVWTMNGGGQQSQSVVMHLLALLLREREWRERETERNRHVSVCCYTHSCTHWLSLACALPRDKTRKFGISRQTQPGNTGVFVKIGESAAGAESTERPLSSQTPPDYFPRAAPAQVGALAGPMGGIHLKPEEALSAFNPRSSQPLLVSRSAGAFLSGA